MILLILIEFEIKKFKLQRFLIKLNFFGFNYVKSSQKTTSSKYKGKILGKLCVKVRHP